VIGETEIVRLSAEEIQRLRAEFDQQNEIARSLREPPARAN